MDRLSILYTFSEDEPDGKDILFSYIQENGLITEIIQRYFRETKEYIISLIDKKKYDKRNIYGEIVYANNGKIYVKKKRVTFSSESKTSDGGRKPRRKHKKSEWTLIDKPLLGTEESESCWQRLLKSPWKFF